MKERIVEVIDEQIANLENLKKNSYSEGLIQIVDIVTKSLKSGGKLMIAGNGGSAADSQHFAAELVGRFMKERRGLPAIALTTDSSVLTSMGNDYGYDSIIKRQIEALGNENDVFIGISNSGNSSNIIEAVLEEKKKNIITVGLLGRDGGKLKEMCERA